MFVFLRLALNSATCGVSAEKAPPQKRPGKSRRGAHAHYRNAEGRVCKTRPLPCQYHPWVNCQVRKIRNTFSTALAAQNPETPNTSQRDGRRWGLALCPSLLKSTSMSRELQVRTRCQSGTFQGPLTPRMWTRMNGTTSPRYQLSI